MVILHPNERNAKKGKTVLYPCVFSRCCVLKERHIHKNLLQNDVLLISLDSKRSIEILEKTLPR